MEFATAVDRLTYLLAKIQWPVEIEWILPEHVLHYPMARRFPPEP